MSVLLYADERVLEHRPTVGHPERPERFSAAIAGIEAAGFGDALIRDTPSIVPVEALLGVHTDQHVKTIESYEGLEYVQVERDTRMSEGSLLAARLAAGAGLDAITGLQEGRADAAMVVMRPPGHHATPTNAMGFCLFNNVAVAAHHLTTQGHKVAIIDFDAHHGNGTQDIFYERDDVMFVSLHEYPQYPGTGAASETGAGPGEGSTINVPMPSGTTGDVYLRAFDEIIEPALESFGADWLLISAGFDAHRADPITNLGLTSGDFADMCTRLVSYSKPGQRLAFLEGGYDLHALANSTASCVAALLGEDLRAESSSSGSHDHGVVDLVKATRQ
ncbi:MAG: histone deacetylase [Acidimicrobiia bacterium]|nr:histone deacetylase [Acidimicrobiia bacterium]RZV42565.1 MAG: histone deacetylase [Acidimicrobiales bacterium]